MKVMNISAHPRFVQKRVPVKVKEKDVGVGNSAIRLLDMSTLYRQNMEHIGRFDTLVVRNVNAGYDHVFKWEGYVGKIKESEFENNYALCRKFYHGGLVA